MGITNQETLFISKFGHEKNLGYEATIDNIDNHLSLRTVPQTPAPAPDGADWRGHLLPGYQHQIQRAGGQGVVQVIQYSTVQYSTVQYSTVQYSTVQYTRYNEQEIREWFR